MAKIEGKCEYCKEPLNENKNLGMCITPGCGYEVCQKCGRTESKGPVHTKPGGCPSVGPIMRNLITFKPWSLPF